MTMLQVKMPLKLIEEVKVEMKKDNFGTWTEFLTACFRSYLNGKAQSDVEAEDTDDNQ